MNTAERNEISIHELRVFLVVQASDKWMTNAEIAEAAKVAQRTARHHSHRLVSLGIFDQAEVFPAHRFRVAEKAGKRNAAYMKRLMGAKETFGV